MSAVPGSDVRARAAMAKLVSENPFAYLTQEDIGLLFGFGKQSMGALVAMGVPTVAKRINASHFQRWLWANRERIGKLT